LSIGTGGVELSGQRKGNPRRSYRPTVEALEALRLLSSALQSAPDLPAVGAVLTSAPTPLAHELPGPGEAWDAALDQTHLDLADLLGPTTQDRTAAVPQPDLGAQGRDVQAGLMQLNRYLGRAWFRAGIPVQHHDDATQAVYVTLLQNLGRDRFDALAADIGRLGIRDVLSRETPEGPDFFRAIDTVKKRVQRERTYQPIDAVEVASPAPGEDALALWRSALQEVIDQSLTPREASLVYDTLMGKTPAEIAQQWGVAPKTVSNEKTRVIQKLRDALVTDPSE
jgi:DNA-directed RNA polymerase specialized sigma24 family protein